MTHGWLFVLVNRGQPVASLERLTASLKRVAKQERIVPRSYTSRPAEGVSLGLACKWRLLGS